MDSILSDEDEGDDPPDWAGERGGRPDRGEDTVGQGGRPEGAGGRPEGVGGGDEDSDRPEWAGTPGGSAGRGGSPDAGQTGDLYGDLYVILRDDSGAPILSESGFVQPLASADVDGDSDIDQDDVVPLDEEGHVPEEYLDPVQEVEIGRTNVARATDSVLENRLEEAVATLNSADAITLDPAGRLVVTVDGEERTIDSPLENLAIYEALMTEREIPGLAVDLPIGDDLAAAATFLAAATDKSAPLTVDEAAYLNRIPDINVVAMDDNPDVTYSDVDFSAFSYDRSIYDSDVEVLVETSPGIFEVHTVNLLEVVFDDTAYSGGGTLDAFTQAADDARPVINYIHEYEIPADI